MPMIKWIFFLTMLCFFTYHTGAQQKKHAYKPRQKIMVAQEDTASEIHVEVKASFAYGQDSLAHWLRRNIRYPAAAREDGVEGKVTARFLLDTLGKATRTEILRGIGAGCDQEVLRVLKQMPAWKPSRYNGRPVPYLVTLSIRFRIKA